ncbi:MAG TPA: ABC transporter permease [Fimbriimonadaceae bacterium]|nr:ABC transporter permease [Fimbriimonadaceae bacterium]
MGSFDLILLLKTAPGLSLALLLAAMGGLTSERSGIINIALEGKMLISCCVTALMSVAFGPWIGLLGGIGAAVVLAMLHAVLTQMYRVDHIVSGMAINIIAFGASNFLDKKFTDINRTGEIPQLPFEFYYVAAFALPLVLWLYLRRTKGGLRLWAVGNDPDKARQMGVDPVKVRYLALLATGVFCGLAGAWLVTNAGRFVDGMTAGRGFIALAALILGGWRPIPAALACIAFGLLDSIQLQLQGSKLLGAGIPSQFWNSLPYLATLIALAGLLGRNRAPAGLGKP